MPAMSVARLAMLAVLAMVYASAPACADEISTEMANIRRLSKGQSTDFAEAERRCARLLESHESDDDRGRIFYQMAIFYGSTGQARPDKTAEYAQAALELPLDPVDRLQLYVYWGDSVQVKNGPVTGDAFVAARADAAKPYLLGLKEAHSFQLPEQITDSDFPPSVRIPIELPAESEEYKRLKPISDQRSAQRQLLVLKQRLIMHRDTISRQIAFMYSKTPLDTAGLEKLATDILNDKAAVDRLMGIVNEQINSERASRLAHPTTTPTTRASRP